jgi:hypothetical protein
MNIGDQLKVVWDKFSKALVPWVIFMLIAMVLCFTIVLVPTVVRGMVKEGLAFLRTGKEPEYAELWNFDGYLQTLLFCLVAGTLITIGYCLLIVPGVLLSVWWMYAAFYLVDKNMDFWPAMTASKDAVTKAGFMNQLILFIVINVINYAGGALAGFGVLLTAPFALLLMAINYMQLNGEQV